jgi:hypothetical protein
MLCFNKYTAIVILIVFLLIGYFVVSRNKGDGKKRKKKKGKPSKAKSGKTRKSRSKSSESDDEGDEEAEHDADEDDKDAEDIEEDAKELFNMVHEGLARGMQQDEFLEVVGDLADNFIYIELKQLYNACADKKMDPLKAITIKDYIRILKKESQS